MHIERLGNNLIRMRNSKVVKKKKKVKYKTVRATKLHISVLFFNSSKSASLPKQRNVKFPKETYSQLMTLLFFFISMSNIIPVNLSFKCFISNLYCTFLMYYSLFGFSWVFENNQFYFRPTIQLASEELKHEQYFFSKWIKHNQ